MTDGLRYCEVLADSIRRSAPMQSVGFGDDITVVPRGREHHDLVVFSKALWKMPCKDAAAGYEGVYLHFEIDRPGVLLMHCELYPRQGSETRHPADLIAPLLELKGGIAELVREIGVEQEWASKFGWSAPTKHLATPRNLQVGKFASGLREGHGPAEFLPFIERVVVGVVPAIDVIMPCARAPDSNLRRLLRRLLGAI